MSAGARLRAGRGFTERPTADGLIDGLSRYGAGEGVRLFAVYAAVSLVGVLAFGGVLLQTSRQQADQRGLQQAGDEATLIGSTASRRCSTGSPLRWD